MESVYPSVFRLSRGMGANAYVVLAGAESGQAALIDPGMPWDAGSVIGELSRNGLLDKVTDILVTHADIDHVGAAPEVQSATGATVWLGRADAEVLDGTRRASTAYRRLLGRWHPRPFTKALSLLDGGEEPFPGVTSIATPGHTPGHMAFTFGDVVFAGDAVLGTGHGFRQLPGFLTSDSQQALASERLIAGLGARWFCPGHGRVRELAPL